MDRRNEQHYRQKYIEEQLNALKHEEKALNDIRMSLLSQRWQLMSENEQIKKKMANPTEPEPQK